MSKGGNGEREEVVGSGDTGELLNDPAHYRRDLKLIEQSIRRRWNTDERIKDALLAKIARIILTSDNAREQVAAARCYLVAEQQNLADDHKLRPDQVLHAHVDVNAQQAVEDLTVEELRVLRRLRAKVSGEVEPAEHGGNGNGRADGNGKDN